MGNVEPNLTLIGKTNKTHVEINKMLSLLCLLNVYKTFTTVTQTTEMKASSAEKEQRRHKNKLRKWELTPSLPSCFLESIAVTHGAEEDHRQHHQSQLHSPCCLSGHTGSPPATRWSRYVEVFLCMTGEPLCCLEGWSLFFSRWYRSLRLPLLSQLPSRPLVSFTLRLAASASLWSEGWCCGCKSKQAWGTTSHHTGGSSGKRSRQNSDVAWKGRMRLLLKMKRRRKRGKKTMQSWWFNPWRMGWAGRNRRTGWSNGDQLLPDLLISLKILGGDATWQLDVPGYVWTDTKDEEQKAWRKNPDNQPYLVLLKMILVMPVVYWILNKPVILHKNQNTTIT